MTNAEKERIFDTVADMQTLARFSTADPHGYAEQYNGACKVLEALGLYTAFIKYTREQEANK